MKNDELAREIQFELERLKQAGFTGKMTIEINLTQGTIGDVKLSQGWTMKNGKKNDSSS